MYLLNICVCVFPLFPESYNLGYCKHFQLHDFMCNVSLNYNKITNIVKSICKFQFEEIHYFFYIFTKFCQKLNFIYS